jgi:hypothetical protein
MSSKPKRKKKLEGLLNKIVERMVQPMKENRRKNALIIVFSTVRDVLTSKAEGRFRDDIK